MSSSYVFFIFEVVVIKPVFRPEDELVASVIELITELLVNGMVVKPVVAIKFENLVVETIIAAIVVNFELIIVY